jgi:hypothetical protein
MQSNHNRRQKPDAFEIALEPSGCRRGTHHDEMQSDHNRQKADAFEITAAAVISMWL